jgi:hypothetical protein
MVRGRVTNTVKRFSSYAIGLVLRVSKSRNPVSSATKRRNLLSLDNKRPAVNQAVISLAAKAIPGIDLRTIASASFIMR